MLKDKWALVTGVGPGNMGAAVVRRFHDLGINTILVGHDRTRVERVAAQLEGPAQAICRGVDFGEMVAQGAGRFQGLVADMRKEVPEIQILIHAAGYARAAAFLDTDMETWERTFAVNLAAPFFLTQAMVRARWLRHGVIVNIGSTVGEPTHGWAGGMVYSMTKGAMLLWAQMLAVELAPSIRVNTILPGSIDTPMADALLGASGKTRMADSIPLKRLGSVDEVASVVLELVNNPYLSGTEVRVDGARTVGG